MQPFEGGDVFQSGALGAGHLRGSKGFLTLSPLYPLDFGSAWSWLISIKVLIDITGLLMNDVVGTGQGGVGILQCLPRTP